MLDLLNVKTVTDTVDTASNTAVTDTTVLGTAKEVITTITETPADQLLSDLLDKAITFGLKLLAAFAIYIIGMWLIKKIKTLLLKVFEKRRTDAAIVSFVQSIVSITCTIFLILIAVSTLGINTTSIAALLAAGGMAIGMALSGTVQNFAGGIMLLVFKPFKAGDFIEAQGFSGTVQSVTIFNTKLLTPDNKSIMIPNGSLSNGIIDNYSQNKLRRIQWTVGVEYGSSSEETRKAFLDILKKYDKQIVTVEKGAPADPQVFLGELAASSVNYYIRAWVKGSDYWDLYFNVNEAIYNELPKRGINFPFPQLDIFVKNQKGIN